MNTVTILGLIGFIAFIILYFFPSIFAYRTNHRNKRSILVLNIFMGFTYVGWVACLLWAVYKEKVIAPQFEK
ncbi:MAG: superinfection immunity protein [Pseudomonadota bacterium]|nr:superinfection immunity protein [Pseudomonadota bacterium]MDE3036987.1 superinfection immunity protein [Pseudomonadota bacterium]